MMPSMKKVLALLCVCLPCLVWSQQRADSLFHFDIAHPRYPAGQGPVIFLDEAHHNFHTTSGRFRPFADFSGKMAIRSSGTPNPLR